MFRIEGFADDKHVVQLHYLLANLVYDLKIVPVVNAKKLGGKVIAATNGNLVEMFKKYLYDKRIDGDVTIESIKDFLVSSGKSAASYGYLRDNALKANVLRKSGKGRNTRYLVNKGGEKK